MVSTLRGGSQLLRGRKGARSAQTRFRTREAKGSSAVISSNPRYRHRVRWGPARQRCRLKLYVLRPRAAELVCLPPKPLFLSIQCSSIATPHYHVRN